MQEQLVSSHGMLAIMEVLEGKCSRDVLMKLLQIINVVSVFPPIKFLSDFTQLVTADIGFLESFCLIGYVIIPLDFLTIFMLPLLQGNSGYDGYAVA